MKMAGILFEIAGFICANVAHEFYIRTAQLVAFVQQEDKGLTLNCGSLLPKVLREIFVVCFNNCTYHLNKAKLFIQQIKFL